MVFRTHLSVRYGNRSYCPPTLQGGVGANILVVGLKRLSERVALGHYLG